MALPIVSPYCNNADVEAIGLILEARIWTVLRHAGLSAHALLNYAVIELWLLLYGAVLLGVRKIQCPEKLMTAVRRKIRSGSKAGLAHCRILWEGIIADYCNNG